MHKSLLFCYSSANHTMPLSTLLYLKQILPYLTGHINNLNCILKTNRNTKGCQLESNDNFNYKNIAFRCLKAPDWYNWRASKHHSMHNKHWGGCATTAYYHTRFRSAKNRNLRVLSETGRFTFIERERKTPLLFNCPFWLSPFPGEPQKLVLSWPEWNLMWSSPVVTHPLQDFVCCSCWDAFLPTTLTKSVYLNYYWLIYLLPSVLSPFHATNKGRDHILPILLLDIKLLTFICIIDGFQPNDWPNKVTTESPHVLLHSWNYPESCSYRKLINTIRPIRIKKTTTMWLKFKGADVCIDGSWL